MQKTLAKSISTIFGIGYLPLMPGTYASLLGVICYVIFKNHFLFILLALIFTVAGFLSAKYARSIFKKDDPSQVVIDELSGIMVAYLFVPYSLKAAALGFIIFRIIDILKLPPLNRLEKVKGGAGIMLDDIAGGIMTNMLLQIIVRGFFI